MPVLGHAVVGLALAIEFEPRAGSALTRGLGAGFWTPGLITLAFLPDIASQGAAIAGVVEPTPITHSLVLACGLALLLATGLRRGAGMSLASALALATFLVPGHVVLDLLQSPWRPPFWPFSSATIGLPAPLLPETARAEALASAIALAAYLGLRHRRVRAVLAAPNPHLRLALALTAALVGLAAVTHHLRGRSEDRYFEALDRLAEGDAGSALRLADEADRWPQPTRPGRLDYVRAEAYMALQDPRRAEVYLVRSLRAAPESFWPWADLCVLYASSPDPVDERRRRASLCLDRLKTQFADHPDLPRMAARADRALHRESVQGPSERSAPGVSGAPPSGPAP